MNIETHSDYFKRAIADLGQAAHDPERMAIWCYEHPPRKPLPAAKTIGVRDRHVYIARRVFQCLSLISAGTNHVDGLAEVILTEWIKAAVPELWSMYERHDQEIEARIAELRKQEPELQPQEPQEEA